jgi:hypothetical protein
MPQPGYVNWPEEYRNEDGSVNWEKIRKEKGRRPNPETRRLPYKAKAAIVRQEREKLTNKEAAQEINVSLGTYEQYRHCKQGKALIKSTREYLDDPKRFVELHLNDSIPEQFMSLLGDIEAARAAGDYHMSMRGTFRLLEMAGFFDKNQFNVNVDAQNIQITISSGNGSDYIQKALQEGPQPIPLAEYTIVNDKDTSSATT